MNVKKFKAEQSCCILKKDNEIVLDDKSDINESINEENNALAEIEL